MRRHTRLFATLISGFLGIAAPAGVAADAAEVQRGSENRATEARAETQPEAQWVEVTIRMPDGRVLTRKERRFAARVEIPEDLGKPELETGNGRVSQTGNGVAGGSGGGAATFGASTGGGGGGGGGASGSGGGGSAAGGGSTDTADDNSGGGGGGGGGGGHTGAQGRPITVFAWDRSIARRFDNIIETLPIDPRSGTPERAANIIAGRVQAERPAKVVLRFWQELEAADRDPFDLSDPVELWQRGGFRDGLEEYWRAFAAQLRSRGVTPDYLVQDLEKGARLWHVPEEDRRDFFGALFDARQQLTTVLPAPMFSVGLTDFLDGRDQASNVARRAYDQAAIDMRTDIIRDTMHRPFVEVYGRRIDHSNYNDILPSYDVPRHNGSLWVSTSVHGISAPAVYLVDWGTSGNAYSRLQKHPRWNNMINLLNALRSAAHNGPVHPWIAPPGYGRNGPDTWARADQLSEEEWLWDVFMRQCLAMGVDTYILWNPPARWNRNAASNDDYMDRWFGGKEAHGELLRLPAIPFDADQIETNGVVVRYSEFVARFGDR